MSREREGLFNFSVKQFFYALLLMLFIAPFLGRLDSGMIIESLLMTGVFLSGVLAVGARRRSLFIAGLLVAPAILIKWVNLYRPDFLPQCIPPLLGMIFMAYITSHLLCFIIRSPQVDSEILYAAISAYLVIAVFWSLTYTLTATLDPEAFAFNGLNTDSQKMAGLNALYFSFVTLATVGYGDISPVSAIARMLTTAEAVVGIFYMAIVVARLVAVYASLNAAAPKKE
jgi:voltage-gated potassium channel